jgi:anti-sigma B factor antagonist
VGTWFEMRRESMGDGRVRLIVDGELDVASVPKLEQELRWLVRTRASVLLDLTAVTFIDSAGARLLWAAANDAKAGGWSLELVPPLGEVLRVLELVGVASMVSFVG